MAEQASSTAIVPAAVDGEYVLSVREFDAAGKANTFLVPVPSQVSATDMSLMLRSAILKNTTWKGQNMATIIHAVAYSDRMGLDIMAGDVYMAAEGRLSTTAGAKIRHAMNSGRICGYNVEITDGDAITFKDKQGREVYKGPNLRAKVTVNVTGWTASIIYETTLAEWFVAHNPNWVSRPAYMLRRNALSKAFEEVAPMGVESDEAPPVEAIALPQAGSLLTTPKQ